MSKTFGEIAFFETARNWNLTTVYFRRRKLDLMGFKQVLAERIFSDLPAEVRDKMIEEWERDNLSSNM